MHDSDSIDALLDDISYELLDADRVIANLQERGYEFNFVAHGSRVSCTQTRKSYELRHVRVDEIYRFDDSTGSLRGVYLYALTTFTDYYKGILMVTLNRPIEGGEALLFGNEDIA